MFKYIFRPYDPIYPKLFNKEKNRLEEFLGKNILIEHVGSTSIPGMGGKGIIDIAVAVGNKDDLSDVSSKLIKVGYYYNPDGGTDERWFHGRKISDEERYHIHLTFKGSKDWKEILSFRDYLNTHPKYFKKYAEVKKQAVEIANQDKDIYMRIKAPVIRKILRNILNKQDLNLKK